MTQPLSSPCTSFSLRCFSGRPEFQVGFFAVLVLAALWSVVGYGLWRGHAEAMRATERENVALTRTLRGHVQATLDMATVLLHRSADQIFTDGMPTQGENDRYARQLIRTVEPVAQISGMGIFAADGLLRVAVTRAGPSGFTVVRKDLDLSDRDYVQAIFSEPGEHVFVGQPVRSRANGDWVLPVSRPVRDLVGALAGGTVALVNVSTMVSLFDAVRPDGASHVSLVRVSDGKLVAASPVRLEALGKPYTGRGLGTVIAGEGRAAPDILAPFIDADGRLISAVSLPEAGLRLIVATDLDAALLHWRGWRASLVALAYGVSLALLILAVVLVLQWRRRLASEAALGHSRVALVQSVERFERAVAGATSALWEFDLQRGGGYFAPQWETMLGWKNVRDPYTHWRKHLHPEDRSRVLADLRNHLDLHLPFDAEYRLRAADGSWRWVRARGQASWDERGRPQVMSGMVHDITDLRHSEERLRLALEATDEGMWDWDIATGCLFMSARWKTLLGYDADHPFAHHWRTFLRLIRPEDRPAVLGWARDLLQGRVDRRVEEFSMRRANGTWLHVRVAAKITERDDTGAALRMVGTLKDVSRRYEQQAQLEAAKAQAELASRAKSEFLANMSHELRTPLNAISGFSEALEGEIFGPLNGKQMEYVQDIRVSTRHLTDVINDVLDMAKIESGHSDLREEPVEIEEAIISKMQMVRQRAVEKGLSLTDDLEPLPPYLLDNRKFRQIVLNLLSNAIKFTPSGGAVTVRASSRPDGSLDVSVSDTGIGIAPEDALRVWEPFHQVDSRLSRQYEGTGLGLPLVKAMTEMHGGTASLRSMPGLGTTVTVTLPSHRRLSRMPSVVAAPGAS